MWPWCKFKKSKWPTLYNRTNDFDEGRQQVQKKPVNTSVPVVLEQWCSESWRFSLFAIVCVCSANIQDVCPLYSLCSLNLDPGHCRLGTPAAWQGSCLCKSIMQFKPRGTHLHFTQALDTHSSSSSSPSRPISSCLVIWDCMSHQLHTWLCTVTLPWWERCFQMENNLWDPSNVMSMAFGMTCPWQRFFCCCCSFIHCCVIL